MKQINIKVDDREHRLFTLYAKFRRETVTELLKRHINRKITEPRFLQWK